MPSKPHKLPNRTEETTELDPAIPTEKILKGKAVDDEIARIQAKLHAESAETFYEQPAAFVKRCIRWDKVEHSDGPTPYQLKNLQYLARHKRVCVRGPHGLGKTASHAWIVLWFALTRDAKGQDWKAITTASAWRQLTHYLWPEIRRWAKVLDWDQLGRDPFSKDEMLRMNLRLENGEAFAVACEDPATIEGAHADQMLYVYDEAKTIPPETFDATEGAFSGAGDDTGLDAYAIASSTPGEPAGRFYEIHMRKPGLQEWFPVHVSLDDARKAKRLSEKWRKERALQWGENSSIYINRVLGNFAASEEDGVIPLGWVEQAVERWRALDDAGWPELGLMTGMGVDIARSGAAKTVFALKFGHVIRELRHLTKLQTEDTMQAAGLIRAMLTREEGSRRAVVDVIGIGAGVVDRLRELGCNVLAFNASEKTNIVDVSGEIGFTNKRSAAWWNLRDKLDPNSGHEICLPPDDLLIGDLTAPKWKMMSGGKIQVEAKDDIKDRLGRSTDDGDAVVMAFWLDAGADVSAPIFSTQASRWAPAGQRAIFGGGGIR